MIEKMRSKHPARDRSDDTRRERDRQRLAKQVLLDELSADKEEEDESI